MASARLNDGLPGGAAPETTTIRDAALPALAWRGVLSEGRLAFTVGPKVSRFADGFFEGVWAGDFGEFSEARNRVTFGSGAHVGADGITILVPKCSYEQVYVLRDRKTGRTHIANSLCHCLVSAGIGPASPFFDVLASELIEAAGRQARQGALADDLKLVARDGLELIGIGYNNFRIDRDGVITLDQPYHGRHFKNFWDYRTFLAEMLGQILANASDPRRERSLVPTVAVSQGYDSPAVAVLAAEQGCREALCLDVRVWGHEDSGEAIARQLGLTPKLGQHPLGREIGDLKVGYGPELVGRAAEFLTTAGFGDDIAYAAFEPWLGDRVLLTGAWGDSIWQRGSTVDPGLPVRIRYGRSLTEFRLRVGFAHVPVPTIGGFHPQAIVAVGGSSEMLPFSVGGAYDRPIPRRFVEEAGISRGSFAVHKAAVNPTPLNRAGLWRDAMAATMQRYTS